MPRHSSGQPGARRPGMTPAERAHLDEHLRALVLQAFELRQTPYLRDAVDAIVAAYERKPLTLLERRQERTGRLIRLMRETDPRTLRTLRTLDRDRTVS